MQNQYFHKENSAPIVNETFKTSSMPSNALSALHILIYLPLP